VGAAFLAGGFRALADQPLQALYLLVPLECGAICATLKCRADYIARWKRRRSDPEDRITREFGKVEIR